MAANDVLFSSPRDKGLFVKVGLPPGFDVGQYRKVDELAKKVYEIANNTGPATFKDFPLNSYGIVALMVAQKCCYNEAEWNRVANVSKAVLFLTYGDKVRGLSLNEETLRYIGDK